MSSTEARSGAVSVARPEPGSGSVIAAFASVYVIWGSTYLAIRFAIESMPPLLMASSRFLIAGVLLYAWSRLSGSPRPTRAEWKASVVAGGLMLGGGNGAVSVAEQWVPSGLAALLVASVPVWMVVLDLLFGSRARPSLRAAVGLLMGFGGVALLGGAPALGGRSGSGLLGALLILAGCAAWAAGSIYVRDASAPSRSLLWVATQMLTGGAVLGLLGLAAGEAPKVDLGAVTLKSALALAYLVVFGSIIAYSAYVWLARVASPVRLGTYAYVNPVIALFLGWALADEPISFRSLVAAAVIVGSVVVIVSEGRRLSVRGVPGTARRPRA